MAQEIENTEILPVDSNDLVICTVDLSTAAGKLALVNAYNDALPLKDYMNVPLHVRDILMIPSTRAVSHTSCFNTYLILDDGTARFSQSDGVARAAKLICAVHNNDFSATNGITLIAKDKKLPNGNTLKTLVMAAEEQ